MDWKVVTLEILFLAQRSCACLALPTKLQLCSPITTTQLVNERTDAISGTACLLRRPLPPPSHDARASSLPTLHAPRPSPFHLSDAFAARFATFVSSETVPNRFKLVAKSATS